MLGVFAVNEEIRRKMNIKRFALLITSVFLVEVLLVRAVIVDHFSPRWWGIATLILFLGVGFGLKYFVGWRGSTKEEPAKQPTAPVSGVPLDNVARQRLLRALTGAQFLVVLFALGFLVFVSQVSAGSMHLPWWAVVVDAVIGLVMLAWAIKLVIGLKRKLGPSRG